MKNNMNTLSVENVCAKRMADLDVLERGHAAFMSQHAHPALIPFAGLKIYAPSNVYHPWPQSSTHLLRTCMPEISRCQVLEMGCGTGALGLMLADPRLGNEVTLCDTDPAAIAAAEINAAVNERFARVVRSDLFESFRPDRRWDVIVFNPPLLGFAPLGIAHPMATDVGGRIAKRFINELAPHLKANGKCFLTWLQDDEAGIALFKTAGLQVKKLGQDSRDTGICVQVLEVFK